MQKSPRIASLAPNPSANTRGMFARVTETFPRCCRGAQSKPNGGGLENVSTTGWPNRNFSAHVLPLTALPAHPPDSFRCATTFPCTTRTFRACLRGGEGLGKRFARIFACHKGRARGLCVAHETHCRSIHFHCRALQTRLECWCGAHQHGCSVREGGGVRERGGAPQKVCKTEISRKSSAHVPTPPSSPTRPHPLAPRARCAWSTQFARRRGWEAPYAWKMHSRGVLCATPASGSGSSRKPWARLSHPHRRTR